MKKNPAWRAPRARGARKRVPLTLKSLNFGAFVCTRLRDYNRNLPFLQIAHERPPSLLESRACLVLLQEGGHLVQSHVIFLEGPALA